MAIDKRRVQLLEVIHAFAVAAANKTSDAAIFMAVVRFKKVMADDGGWRV